MAKKLSVDPAVLLKENIRQIWRTVMEDVPLSQVLYVNEENLKLQLKCIFIIYIFSNFRLRATL